MELWNLPVGSSESERVKYGFNFNFLTLLVSKTSFKVEAKSKRMGCNHGMPGNSQYLYLQGLTNGLSVPVNRLKGMAVNSLYNYIFGLG